MSCFACKERSRSGLTPKTCATPGNVRWTTQKQQCRNRRSTKLTKVDVEFIRHWIDCGYKQKEIAAPFHVDSSLISRIGSGAYWAEEG